jgi:hypothetical protein
MRKDNKHNDRERAQKLLIHYYDLITHTPYAKCQHAGSGITGFFSTRNAAKHEEIGTKLAVSFFEGIFKSLGSAIGGLANRFFDAL